MGDPGTHSVGGIMCRLDMPWGSADVPVTQIDGHYVFQGDIILGEVTQDAAVAGLTTLGRFSLGLWPRSIVPWQARAETYDRALAAVSHFADAGLPLLFIERTPENQTQFPDFIEVVRGSKCSSRIGRTGSRQEIVLQDDCQTAEAIHEFCHALGLHHEQSRPDRNDFVMIQYDNIRPENWIEFNIVENARMIGEYDFASIMHYGPRLFAMDPTRDTITALRGQRIGHDGRLSEGDRRTLTAFYADERFPYLVPAHRYWNGEVGDHCYTSAWSELGRGRGLYAYEGIEWWMLARPVQRAECVPLYRFYSDVNRDHMYRTTAEALPGYHLEHTELWVFDRQLPHTVPVYEYYSESCQDHFYTTGLFDNDKGYSRTQLSFYAFPNFAEALQFKP